MTTVELRSAMETTMSTHALYKVAAAALVVSAVSMIVGRWMHPPVDSSAMGGPLWVLAHMLLWLGSTTAVVGLTALYLRQRERVGRLGFIGLIVACLGLIALSGAFYFEGVVVPSLATGGQDVMRDFPAAATWGPYLAAVAGSGAAVAVGFVFFGVASYRAAILPRWAVVVTTGGAIAAGLQFLLPGPIALLAFLTLGVGLTALGWALSSSVANLRISAARLG